MLPQIEIIDRVADHTDYARSDHPIMLSPYGWEQLVDYGIRTIVSLETAGLEGENALRANRPVVTPEELDITLMQLPIEDGADEQFIDRWARSDPVGDGRSGWPMVARSRGNRILARRDQGEPRHEVMARCALPSLGSFHHTMATGSRDVNRAARTVGLAAAKP